MEAKSQGVSSFVGLQEDAPPHLKLVSMSAYPFLSVSISCSDRYHRDLLHCLLTNSVALSALLRRHYTPRSKNWSVRSSTTTFTLRT